jgi:hypothetical protein
VKRSTSLTKEQLADVHRRIRNGARELSRAIKKGARSEARRLYDRIFGPLESESIQRMVAHLPAAEEDRMVAFALEWGRESLSRVMSDRARRPRPNRREKFAKRNDWLREQYYRRQSSDSSYSVARFCTDLDHDRIRIPTDLKAQIKPNDELLSDQWIGKITRGTGKSPHTSISGISS